MNFVRLTPARITQAVSTTEIRVLGWRSGLVELSKAHKQERSSPPALLTMSWLRGKQAAVEAACA